MKRFFIMIISLIILFSVSSALASSDYWKFSNFGSTEGIEDLFEGDMFSLDLYMNVTDLSAWIVETVWSKGQSSTLCLRADVKSKAGDNHLYFVLENGHTVKGHYDQNGYDFWMDFDSGSLKLCPCDEFYKGSQFVGGKFAEGTP